LLVVADGLGGHASGERAAEIAVDALSGFDANSTALDRELTELVRHANRNILQAAAEDLSHHGMGTTLTAAFISNGTAHWVHVGDSRLYLFRDQVVVQVTEDQTPVGLLLRTGELSPEEARVHPARHMLMSCLGRCELEVECGALDLQRGDLILLSTDGLHDLMSEELIADILGSKRNLDDRMDDLVAAALAAGGRDNVTVAAAVI
ncbi:MAG TPA: protein phosphatase 2C domain-containing protein, partial [Syntrophobacteraceae bacterium]|nr:protein phosphatase 2C domain-containing protein [Syntrophobacteraceae bacterium]